MLVQPDSLNKEFAMLGKRILVSLCSLALLLTCSYPQGAHALAPPNNLELGAWRDVVTNDNAVLIAVVAKPKRQRITEVGKVGGMVTSQLRGVKVMSGWSAVRNARA